MTRHSPFYILRVDLGECRRTEQDWPIRWVLRDWWIGFWGLKEMVGSVVGRD